MALALTDPGPRRDELALLTESFDRLFWLPRSLTGEGVRASHAILGELLPLERIEVPSGSVAFDWTVPPEWKVGEAYLVGPDGRRFCDWRDHPLHLLNYSIGFEGEVTRAELDEHLHSKPELPEAIPYVTSYYKPRWGFCLSDEERRALPEGTYRAVIEAAHDGDGSLTLSEAALPGEREAEVFFSSYTCHPALANDELCGPLVLALLGRRIAAWPRRRLTYRFALHAETIGALAYLTLRGEHLKSRMRAGYVVTNVGAPRPPRYKRSRHGATAADRAAEAVLARDGEAVLTDFEPLGSDERQFCSPGFDLPLGTLSRTPNSYREYHSSLDNRDFIDFEAVQATVDLLEEICRVLEADEGPARDAPRFSGGRPGPRYRNLTPQGEPQLGRHGLYPTLGQTGGPERRIKALLWALNQADGSKSLADIAAASGLDEAELGDATEACVAAGLMERVD